MDTLLHCLMNTYDYEDSLFMIDPKLKGTSWFKGTLCPIQYSKCWEANGCQNWTRQTDQPLYFIAAIQFSLDFADLLIRNPVLISINSFVMVEKLGAGKRSRLCAEEESRKPCWQLGQYKPCGSWRWNWWACGSDRMTIWELGSKANICRRHRIWKRTTVNFLASASYSVNCRQTPVLWKSFPSATHLFPPVFKYKAFQQRITCQTVFSVYSRSVRLSHSIQTFHGQFTMWSRKRHTGGEAFMYTESTVCNKIKEDIKKIN